MLGGIGRLALVALVWIGLLDGAVAQQASSNPQDVLRALNFRHGPVTLGDNLATIGQSQDYVYLDSADAEAFLTRIWGNPLEASRGTLGMLLPVKSNPLSAEGWGVVITYQATGYVSDDDAEKIDYPKLLQGMQEAISEASKERVSHGYQPYELVGWARAPYYDKVNKKLYWAKQLKFGNAPDDTLNYEIRVLGRQGVLSLNVVADLKQFPQIDSAASGLLSLVSFNPGNLYSEFNPSVDKVATYGLAGLIAGGLLTKAGFFKGLIALLLASKKLAFVALAAACAGLWGGIKALGRRRTPV